MVYEFDGKAYRTYSRHQNAWGLDLIARTGLNGNESILDLGCGDGSLTKVLADLVPEGKVLGIDASAGMIREAKPLEGPNLRFELMEISKIEFESQFDIIFSNATLHWVKDHDCAMKAICKALKEDGVILFEFAGKGNCETLFSVIREMMDDKRYRSYFTDFKWPWYMPTKQEYQQLLNSTPLAEFEIQECDRPYRFSSYEDLVGWIDQPCIVPFLKELPEDMAASFRDAVIEGTALRTRQPDGTYQERFRRLRVTGEKGCHITLLPASAERVREAADALEAERLTFTQDASRRKFNYLFKERL